MRKIGSGSMGVEGEWKGSGKRGEWTSCTSTPGFRAGLRIRGWRGRGGGWTLDSGDDCGQCRGARWGISESSDKVTVE